MPRISWIRTLKTKRWITKNKECQEQRVYKQFYTAASYLIHQPVSPTCQYRTTPENRGIHSFQNNAPEHQDPRNPHNPRNPTPWLCGGELVSPPTRGLASTIPNPAVIKGSLTQNPEAGAVALRGS